MQHPHGVPSADWKVSRTDLSYTRPAASTCADSDASQSRLRRRRAGWSLIEMLVTISVMSALTGVAVKVLTVMLASERTGIEHVSRLSTLSRLSWKFRTDAHRATGVEISTDGAGKPFLLFNVGTDHQIQYDKDALGLSRTERRPNQPVARELWRLKGARFDCIDSAGPPRLLTLVVGITDPALVTKKNLGPTVKELRIDVIVGRDVAMQSAAGDDK